MCAGSDILLLIINIHNYNMEDLLKNMVLKLLTYQPEDPFHYICDHLSTLASGPQIGLTQALDLMRSLKYNDSFEESFNDKVYSIFVLLCEKEIQGVTSLELRMPFNNYQQFIEQLLTAGNNGEEKLKTTLFSLQEPYISYQSFHKSLSLYLSFQEYCRLSYEVYNQITMTTDVEATIILTELASAVTRGTSLQLSSFDENKDNSISITKDQFISTAIKIFIEYLEQQKQQQ